MEEVFLGDDKIHFGGCLVIATSLPLWKVGSNYFLQPPRRDHVIAGGFCVRKYLPTNANAIPGYFIEPRQKLSRLNSGYSLMGPPDCLQQIFPTAGKMLGIILRDEHPRSFS